MARTDMTLWGMHAGRTGDADTLFLKKGFIAVGWAEVGDLSRLKPDREAFKAKIAEAYPDKKPGAIPLDAGQLFRFTYEMKQGDVIVYASKQDRLVHIGEVIGNYKYDPSVGNGYPNLRSVRWIRSVPRTHFTQGALYEIGSAMSLFQVKNYADEFLVASEGKTAQPPVETDETVALLAEEIEATTRDYILKKLAQELKGHPLTYFVAHLLGIMGYRTRVSPEGPDGGVDIIAHKDELGFEPPIIKVQVKSSEGNIGSETVQALYGNVGTDEYGLLVTLGGYSNPAYTFARNKSNLRLINGEELVDLVFLHYEQFDSRYKGLLPLKRVYIPEALEESSE